MSFRRDRAGLWLKTVFGQPEFRSSDLFFPLYLLRENAFGYGIPTSLNCVGNVEVTIIYLGVAVRLSARTVRGLATGRRRPCGVCLSPHHDIVDCPFVLFNGNVDGGAKTYAEAQAEMEIKRQRIYDFQKDVEKERWERAAREEELEVTLRSCERQQSKEHNRERELDCERVRNRERNRERNRSRERRLSRERSVGSRGSRSPPRRCRDRSSLSPRRSPSPYDPGIDQLR